MEVEQADEQIDKALQEKHTKAILEAVEAEEQENIEFDVQPMPLQVEELWIALSQTLFVFEHLRTRVEELEARIEDHNERASHKI